MSASVGLVGGRRRSLCRRSSSTVRGARRRSSTRRSRITRPRPVDSWRGSRYCARSASARLTITRSSAAGPSRALATHALTGAARLTTVRGAVATRAPGGRGRRARFISSRGCQRRLRAPSLIGPVASGRRHLALTTSAPGQPAAVVGSVIRAAPGERGGLRGCTVHRAPCTVRSAGRLRSRRITPLCSPHRELGPDLQPRLCKCRSDRSLPNPAFPRPSGRPVAMAFVLLCRSRPPSFGGCRG